VYGKREVLINRIDMINGNIIAGPCQHESLIQSFEIAKECKRVCDKYGYDYYFKSSFDKANRTSEDGIRGLGLRTTLLDFKEIKKELDVKMLTDVHTPKQIDQIIDWFYDVIDVLQIPAFLCRQTDLIHHACSTNKIVNIKKGQFLAPWDVKGILSKTEEAQEVWITERGTSFGYNTLVVDFTGIDWMLKNLDIPVVLDCTHSVQKPGGNGTSSGGNRDFVPALSRAGSAVGVKNFFIEVHADPDNAPSDGANMVRLSNFENIIRDIKKCKYER
jgi:2-dehydro-3-deoxyphosphooctonate aldolase (KDO 8-P synthase)